MALPTKFKTPNMETLREDPTMFKTPSMEKFKTPSMETLQEDPRNKALTGTVKMQPQVGLAGQAQEQAAQPPGLAGQAIQPGSNYMDRSTTSADRLTNMIDENSPYIQSAVNYANEASSGRGRINSSYAAGAGTRAAIDAAAPFAQQDAQTAAQFNLQEQTAESQLVRDNAQNEANALTASKLAETNLVREQLVQDATMARLNVSNQHAIDTALTNADAEATSNFNTVYGAMSQQLTQGLANIDSSDIDNAQAAKDALIAAFNHNVLGLINITNAGLGDYQIEWEPNTSIAAGGTTTDPPPSPAPPPEKEDINSLYGK